MEVKKLRLCVNNSYVHDISVFIKMMARKLNWHILFLAYEISDQSIFRSVNASIRHSVIERF